MHFRTRLIALATVTSLAAAPASAQQWTSWNSADVAGVYGLIGPVAVDYVGTYSTYENSAASGINFWSPSGAYSQNGVIAPTNRGLIRFVGAAGGTINFSSAVVNPFIAFNSVGQPRVGVTYDFQGAPFTVVSNNNAGGAYWGPGSYTTSGSTLTGNEFSGVVQFTGTYSSLSFTTTAENWHGITVGIESLAPPTNVVPEPSTYAMFGAGLLALGLTARRRRDRKFHRPSKAEQLRILAQQIV